jgi:ubiquinone/menaquinone biosynthesis C-methylase UbiE
MIKKRFSFRSLINAISHHNFRRIEECSTLIRWLAAKPGEHILDVGCGDGYYDKLIGKSGAKVIGIDIHERRLSTAYHLYRSEDTEFIYMDAAGMSFREASFDKVVSFCVVEHFYNDEQVIRNISRVLKPGAIWKVVSHFAGRTAVHSDSGLTLLIHAKKRDTDGGNH